MMMMVMMILRTVGDGDLEDDNDDDDPVYHVYIKTFGYLFISKSIEMFDSDENVNVDGDINSLSIGKDSKPALSLSSNRIGKLSLGGWVEEGAVKVKASRLMSCKRATGSFYFELTNVEKNYKKNG